jgi:hypothetical protein
VTVQHLGVQDDVSLVDLLDRLIEGGVVLVGDVVLSVADVDLVYVGLRLVLAPAHKIHPSRAGGAVQPSLDSGG